ADNFQNVFGKAAAMADFNEFYERLVISQQVKLILIFSGPLHMKLVPSTSVHIKPLDITDSIQFLHSSLPKNLTSSQELLNLCSKFCDNIPGRIVALCDMLSQCPADVLPRDIINYLSNNQNIDIFLTDDFAASFLHYFSQFPKQQQEALSQLSYFPGKFSLHDMMSITNHRHEQQAKFQLAFPLINQGLMKTTDTSVFVLSPVVQKFCRNHVSHVLHEDHTKLKFNRIIGEAFIEAEKVREKGLIYDMFGIFQHKWDSFVQLIGSAIHSPSDGDSFQLYCKVAVEARNIISHYIPNASTQFFKAMLDASRKVGSEVQTALLMVSYGQSLLQNSGIQSAKEAQWHFKQALHVLLKHGHNYQALVTYNYATKNYHRQGKLQKGIRCAEKALEIPVFDKELEEVEHTLTYTYTYLSHSLIFAGEHERAHDLLEKRLIKVGETGHPAVYDILNCLGLNAERSGSSPTTAMQYYLSSLFTKRKVSYTQEHILVPSLCNIAGLFSKSRQKHELALKFLHEAEAIRRQCGWENFYTALVLWIIGMVNMRRGQHKEALPFLNEANSVYDLVSPDHYANVEIKVWLAHCLHLLGDVRRVEEVLVEALGKRSSYVRFLPHGESICTVLEHLVRLYAGNLQKCLQYLQELTFELNRLSQCPSVSAEKVKNYRKFYDWYLAVRNNLYENHLASINHLERLPFTCLPCQEAITFHMHQNDEVYVKSLCIHSLRNSSLQKLTSNGLSGFLGPSSSVKTLKASSLMPGVGIKDSTVPVSPTNNNQEIPVLPNFDLLLDSSSLEDDSCDQKCFQVTTTTTTVTATTTTMPKTMSANFPIPDYAMPKSISKEHANITKLDSWKTEDPEEESLHNSKMLHSSLTDGKYLLKTTEENDCSPPAPLDLSINNLQSLLAISSNVCIEKYEKNPPYKMEAARQLEILSDVTNPEIHKPLEIKLKSSPTAGFGALEKRRPILPVVEGTNLLIPSDGLLHVQPALSQTSTIQNDIDLNRENENILNSPYSGNIYQSGKRFYLSEKHERNPEMCPDQVGKQASEHIDLEKSKKYQADSRYGEQLLGDWKDPEQNNIDLKGTSPGEHFMTDKKVSEQSKFEKRGGITVKPGQPASKVSQTESFRRFDLCGADPKRSVQNETDQRDPKKLPVGLRHPSLYNIDIEQSRRWSTHEEDSSQPQLDHIYCGQVKKSQLSHEYFSPCKTEYISQSKQPMTDNVDFKQHSPLYHAYSGLTGTETNSQDKQSMTNKNDFKQSQSLYHTYSGLSRAETSSQDKQSMTVKRDTKQLPPLYHDYSRLFRTEIKDQAKQSMTNKRDFEQHPPLFHDYSSLWKTVASSQDELSMTDKEYFKQPPLYNESSSPCKSEINSQDKQSITDKGDFKQLSPPCHEYSGLFGTETCSPGKQAMTDKRDSIQLPSRYHDYSGLSKTETSSQVQDPMTDKGDFKQPPPRYHDYSGLSKTETSSQVQDPMTDKGNSIQPPPRYHDYSGLSKTDTSSQGKQPMTEKGYLTQAWLGLANSCPHRTERISAGRLWVIHDEYSIQSQPGADTAKGGQLINGKENLKQPPPIHGYPSVSMTDMSLSQDGTTNKGNLKLHQHGQDYYSLRNTDTMQSRLRLTDREDARVTDAGLRNYSLFSSGSIAHQDAGMTQLCMNRGEETGHSSRDGRPSGQLRTTRREPSEHEEQP
ncbi:hypothetical protein Ahia01_000496900, partial [Argonauta hians]